MLKARIDVFSLLERVRKVKPVVHHLTNWVTIYDCAQVVKVLGASPVMAHAPEEVSEMAKLASALVLNIGTLTTEFVNAMKIAAKSAYAKGIPIVLDACGVGATRLRDEKCLELLEEAHIAIVKGNASEIARLAGENVQTKGVDASSVQADLVEVAGRLSKRYGCTVVLTGAEDIVLNNGEVFLVRNGDIFMTRVVGTGCMAASVIGAFAAVEKNRLCFCCGPCLF